MSSTSFSPARSTTKEEIVDDDDEWEPLNGETNQQNGANVGDSQDDDDDEEEEDDDDDDMEDDPKAAKGEWKQHLVAVLIAVVAAFAAHSRFSTSSSSSASSIQSPQLVMQGMTAPSRNHYNNNLNQERHEHLHTYKRLSNISFCGSLPLRQPNERLHVMDFNIQRDLMDATTKHFYADALEDDDYSQHEQYVQEMDDNPEYVCLWEQNKAAVQLGHKIIKGTTYYYKTPSIQEIYNTYDDPKLQPAVRAFTGFAAKFINLSPQPLLLFWDGKGGTADAARLVAELAPFQSVGTATTPGMSFHITPVYDSSDAIKRWVLTADTALIVYHPIENDNGAIANLSPKHKLLYDMHLLHLSFARDYLVASGRSWLSNFPRPPPMHYMHPAYFMGQQHQVELDYNGTTAPRTWQVESVAPRVLVMDDFLTLEECQHIIALAKEQGMKRSSLHAGGEGGGRDTPKTQRDNSTRSSTNAWLDRDSSEIVDGVYHRAAQAMHIDESLLRHRSELRYDIASHHSIAESLQVIRYKKGQQYTPHHDFVYPDMQNRYQPTRFATLLLYLNDVEEGGETTFPRAITKDRHDGVVITPKPGKAVLFYNVLPDGNVDDLSQHGAQKVKTGEKWAANLWIWDPLID